MSDADLQTVSPGERAADLCRRRHLMAGPAPGVPCQDCRGLVAWMNDMLTPRIITGPVTAVDPDENYDLRDTGIPPIRLDPDLTMPGYIPPEPLLPEGQGLIAFLVGASLGLVAGAIGITLVRVWFW